MTNQDDFIDHSELSTPPSPLVIEAVEEAPAVAQALPREKKKTTIGGQALIEGLMMVGPRRSAMAVRKADGSILVEEVASNNKVIFFDKVPLVRGGIKLFRQLVTGTGALMKSAELSEDLFADPVEVDSTPPEVVLPEAELSSVETIIPETGETETSTGSLDQEFSEPELTPEEKAQEQLVAVAEKARTAAEGKADKPKASGRLETFLENHLNVVIVASATFGIIFSIGLFILFPRLVVDILSGFLPDSIKDQTNINILLNLFEGILRIGIFVGYLALTSRIKDISRVWMYHGAEHKTIACYEAGEELTVANIRKFSRFHPRCGTAFLFIVVIVSILVFSVVGAFIGINVWWLNALIRLALVPLVAGIAYEIIRFTGRHDKNILCRLITKPGLWMQRFTTREPTDDMLEVAIASVEAVLPEHEGEDTW